MFNPHIHQQQQQQQLHQHLRQLQQLFQQQPPPPPPPQPPPAHHVAHHHQTPRAIPVAPQTAPPPRMVNLCQATQTTIIAPNPMLQGALLMQQMQGNMRGFGMGGQQFRQFFTAGTRSSLLGPVPMGMAIKTPMMGFPAARPFHPHARFFNTTTTTSTASSSSSISTTDTAARQTDRKRDSEQMVAGSTDDQPSAAVSSSEATDKTQTDVTVEGEDGQISEEQLEEPVVKKQRTEGSEKSTEECVDETVTDASSEFNPNTEDTQPKGCSIQEDVNKVLEEACFNEGYSSLAAQLPSEDDQQVNLPAEETSQEKDAPVASPESQDDEEGGVAEGSSKFYCYLCSITCHNQQNFRSHMNSIAHQQRMMEIQHMSNACLVTLLPRVQESLQGASKDGEKKDSKRWCATCHTHFTCSITDHRRSEEHKLASITDISSCAICKKRFKTSQNFLEHLHSQEHRQKLKENGCEALAKLTAIDTDGFSLEEVEEEEGEERLRNEEDPGDTEDGWSSLKEVNINDLTSDKQYDSNTVYGSSFLVPVAGFICRLCNKFYHFESSALHTHCKSLKHFENFKRYSTLVSQKDEAVQSSRKSILAADNFDLVTETSTDCSDKELLSADTSVAANLGSMQPIITVSRLKMQKENQLQQKEAETDSTSQDLTVSATSTDNLDQDLILNEEEDDTSQAPSAQESTAEQPAGSREEAVLEPEAANDESMEEEEEKESPAGTRKNNGTGKAKTTAKRRSGRAMNRR
ncbi:cdkn1a interacting zinc finger protein 1a [Melanotaenia boesemani]|uniref:cdkn1a interacting zinc finger protein 1a n=1 Tax=Melanotaenia boesemani TaxID=1250792 RepID=UPI001C050D6E|nr:cdkn1a interacting zinc finger protein 1a [Melanotaenia boesemani]